MISNIFSVILIALGSAIEIYYYIFRFQNDGIPLWASAIMGAALTVMLALAVYQKGKNKTASRFIIPLIIYSVLATSAGQSFSFQSYKNDLKKSDVQDIYLLEDVEDTKKQIVILDKDIEKLKLDINETINSLEDRFEWKNTTNGAEERLDELKSEREELKTHLKSITSVAKTTSDIKTEKQTIYEFYNSLLGGGIPTNWIQWVFQTMLSFFIACMAPLGIMSWKRKGRKIRKAKKTEPKKTKLTSDMVKRWVTINWMGIRSGKLNTIITRDIFDQFTIKNGEAQPAWCYDKIRTAAVKSGVIQQDGTVSEINEANAFNKIIRVLGG